MMESVSESGTSLPHAVHFAGNLGFRTKKYNGRMTMSSNPAPIAHLWLIPRCSASCRTQNEYTHQQEQYEKSNR
jgi:hypothetical protein